MKRWLFALVCILGCFAAVGPAYAEAAPILIGSFDGWKAHSFIDAGKKICFIASQPQKQEGKFTKRGEVFFFITHWPGDRGRNVVSVAAGYGFKENSHATVDIDSKKFSLFTQEEMAWTEDQAMDNSIVAAFQKGSALIVKGTSRRGTETADTYSLKGGAAAYQAMMNACAEKIK